MEEHKTAIEVSGQSRRGRERDDVRGAAQGELKVRVKGGGTERRQNKRARVEREGPRAETALRPKRRVPSDYQRATTKKDVTIFL
jgi:hypothetical protein